MFEIYYSINATIDLDDIGKACLFLKNFKKTASEIEVEMWRIKNKFFARKYGSKFIALAMLFELQLEEFPYIDYGEKRLAKLKLVSSLILKLLEKGFREN